MKTCVVIYNPNSGHTLHHANLSKYKKIIERYQQKFNRNLEEEAKELQNIDDKGGKEDILLRIATIFNVDGLEEIKKILEEKDLVELRKKNLINFVKAERDRNKIINDYYNEDENYQSDTSQSGKLTAAEHFS